MVVSILAFEILCELLRIFVGVNEVFSMGFLVRLDEGLGDRVARDQAWRFNRSQTSSRQLRLPSTGLAKALDHENMKTLGFDFAVLWDCRILKRSSCTHSKLHPRGHF